MIRLAPHPGPWPEETNHAHYLPDHLHLLALVGAIVPLAFVALMLARLETSLGFSVGDVIRGALTGVTTIFTN